jgi:tRNA-splicing ligase RtcB
MGTLGGGNHFIECQADVHGNIWFMVHSGSRNIGKKVCDHFNKIAEDLNAKWYSNTTIPFLPATSEEGKQYIGWMYMALHFAYFNRIAMLNEIERNLLHYFPNMKITTSEIGGSDIRGSNIINIHHNYATIENHFGKNVWVHRKGATLASDKTIGIIPGSMGSFSYITKGLGNKDSLNSCSHGAGRRMGRNDFNKAYNTEAGIKEIQDTMKGITHTKFGKAVSRKGKDLGMLDISEAPQAYKDIDEVMDNQVDLVTPIVKLRPIINWKDTGEE